ncbi:MAG: hypothetical protein KAQ98_12850 [Bacteriovoracaceae bacterium]|nr:hypothetical protein [Bacteriovoracaceae bacterium]
MRSVSLNLLSIILTLSVVSGGAFSYVGGGGLIGGGDVNSKPLIECYVENVVEHEISVLKIINEVDYDGNFIEDSSFSVILLNVFHGEVRRLSSKEKFISSLSNFEIYNSHKLVGHIEFEKNGDESSSFTGNLYLKNQDKDFELTDCRWQ